MAGPTRLELATSGVTGRRSNQLNYDPAQGAVFLPSDADEVKVIWKSPLSSNAAGSEVSLHSFFNSSASISNSCYNHTEQYE